MSETIVLDPSAVATGRTEFDITGLIQAAGVDWGESQIEAYMAEGTRGQVPVDFRVPNRTITIPLVIKAISGLTYDQARQKMQAKVGLIHREGGWLKRVVSGTPLYADVVNATLKLGGSGLQQLRSFDIDATLTLECLPEFYGDEITLDDMTETTAAEMVKVLKLSTVNAVIKGDYPARTRIVVDDDQGQEQLGLLWGLRSRYYSSASTAALAYEAEALTLLDQAALATVSGASGGASNNVVRHAALGVDWTPVLSTDVAGIGAMTHTGTYRVWARARSSSFTPPRVRLLWDVGDLTNPAVNTAVALSQVAVGSFYDLDLGEIRLDASPVGTHRWRGIIQAAGTSGGEGVDLDRIWLVPVDDGYGALVAPISSDPRAAVFSTRDPFNQTAGALTGKTLPLGGTWTFLTGHATDFTVNATTHSAERSVADTGGRSVAAGTVTPSVLGAQVDVNLSALPGGSDSVRQAILARYVDANNYSLLYLNVSGPSVLVGGSTMQIASLVVIAGVTTALAITPLFNIDPVTNWYSLRLLIDAAGRLFGWLYPQGSAPGDPLIVAQHSSLATGGALASGRVGVNDTGVTGVTRSYDNLAVWTPEFDAILHASQSAELRFDGMFREDATGTSYGPVSSVIGDLPRLPPSGIENRAVELFLKATRGDLGSLMDSGIDDISARVFYRPCWLFVPGA